MKIDWQELLTEVVRWLTMIGGALGITWALAKPHAEAFIQKTVSARIEVLDRGLTAVTVQSEELVRAQERTEQELKHLRYLSEETRSDVRALLQRRR